MAATTDILLKIYAGKETLWVAEKFLREHTDLTIPYFKIARIRYKTSVPISQQNGDLRGASASGYSWRWMREKGIFYYDYDYIPNRSPNHYQLKLGTRDDLRELALFGDIPSGKVWAKTGGIERIKKIVWEDLVQARARAVHHYMNTYYFETYRASNYAVAWSYLRVACDYGEKNQWVRLGFDKADDFYEALLTAMEQEGESMEGVKIHNKIGLRNKLKKFAMIRGEGAQFDFLISKKLGNQNAQSVPKMIKNIAIYLRGLGVNWSNDMICRKINELCALMDWQCPSDRTLDLIFESKEVRMITEQSRYGASGRYARLTTSALPMALPLSANVCWQMDGTRVNFMAHKNKGGADAFLYIVVVRDVYSRAIIGWSYGYAESHKMYFEALSMAVKNLHHLPEMLVHDRFPGHNTEQWQSLTQQLKNIGVEISVTSSATGKAQLERAFGTLQSVFMANTPYYYGEGIKSTRRYAHRSEPALVEIRKMTRQLGWDFEQACEQMDGVLERYNSTKLNAYGRQTKPNKSPYDLLNEELMKFENAAGLLVSEIQIDLLFALRKTLKIGASGLLKTEINKVEKNYRIDDYNIIKKYERVMICYNYEDLSRVRVFSESGAFLCEAQELIPIQIYGKERELGRLSAERAKNKKVAAQAREDYAEIVAEVRDNLGDEIAQLMPLSTPKKELERAETALLMEDNYAHTTQENTQEDTQEEEAEIMQEEDCGYTQEELNEAAIQRYLYNNRGRR